MALKLLGGVALLAYAHCATSELLREKAKQREQGELLLPTEPVVRLLDLLENLESAPEDRRVFAGPTTNVARLHEAHKGILDLAKRQ